LLSLGIATDNPESKPSHRGRAEGDGSRRFICVSRSSHLGTA